MCLVKKTNQILLHISKNVASTLGEVFIPLYSGLEHSIMFGASLYRKNIDKLE